MWLRGIVEFFGSFYRDQHREPFLVRNLDL
jgi:hypothetical protein